MLTSLYVFDIYKDMVPLDPARIAAGVITGIGFLGAGTIIREREEIRGLTTAASLWVVAGLGLAAGAGLFVPAIATTLIVLASLFFLNRVEKAMIRRDWYKSLEIETKAGVSELQSIRGILSDYEVEIKDFDVKRSKSSEDLILKINMKLLTSECDNEIITKIRALDGVKKADWSMSADS